MIMLDLAFIVPKGTARAFTPIDVAALRAEYWTKILTAKDPDCDELKKLMVELKAGALQPENTLDFTLDESSSSSCSRHCIWM